MKCMNRCNSICNDYFIKNYIYELGPVIMGNKPIHLFNISKNNENLRQYVDHMDENFSKCEFVDYKRIDKENRIIIIFYNMEAIEELLKDKRNIKFLSSLGHDMSTTGEDYLNFFCDQLKNNKLPHEIGLFFGYPLKDVIGFMGHPCLTCTKVNGWKVFGDPKLSDIKYEEFKKAEKRVKEAVKNNTLHLLLGHKKLA